MARLVYAIFLTVERCLALLPLAAVFRLGSFCGTLAWLFLPPYRCLVLHNLRIAFRDEFSESEFQKLAREHFQRLGSNLLSGIRMGRMDSAEIRKFVHFEHAERFVDMMKSGRGVVLVISHIGNWELFGQLGFLAPDHPRATIYQPLGNPYLDRYFQNLRRRFGITPLDRRKGFTQALTTLREPGLVGVLVDQHAGDSGVWTPFFGRLAATSPLAATLALRTGAALIPAIVYTLPNGPDGPKWRFVVGEEIPVQQNANEPTTLAINRDLEARIRESPADNFWVHNRWKTPKPNFLITRYKRGIHLDGQTLQPFRVAIRSPNWLGDAVMSIPAVEAVIAGRPDLEVTLFTPAKIAPLWQRVKGLHQVVALDQPKKLSAVARSIREAGPFDTAILLTNSLRSVAEMRLGGVRYVAGYAGHFRRRLMKSIVPEPALKGKPEHHTDRYLRMVEYLGATRLPPKISKSVSADPGHKLGEESLRIGICAGAEYGPAKRWPAERFAEVALAVNERRKVTWVLFGVKKDAEIGAAIESALGGTCINLIGKTSLDDLMDELLRCRLLLSNDTGTMHLASSLGVPVVAVFGSTEPALTAPLAANATVIRHHVDCSPCFLRECPLDFRCMKSVSVGEVTEAVLRPLESA